MIPALILKLSPLARLAIAIAIGAAMLGGLILWLGHREAADDTHNQQIGAQVEQGKAATAAIENVKEANDAEEVIRRDPAARIASCRLHSRTPENCDREHVVP